MRVIEPAQLQRRSIKKKKKRRFLPLILLLMVAGSSYALWRNVQPQPIAQELQSNTASTDPQNTTATEPQRTTLKTFSNQQFVDLYSSFAYPNSVEIANPPVITGNPEADIRIRKLAEERGYRLRSAPLSPPQMLEGSVLLQQKAIQPYRDMIAAAKSAGLSIEITSGFRSIDEQRTIFVDRLTATPAAIASGTADQSVIETLKATAPPGYSRHHNGFTIDLACGGIGLYGFLETPCYQWLSKDNFKNAKEYGWIPSYPDGINSVGPEPEPWEYVWVGREALLE